MKADKNNFAPHLGLAWNPNIESGLMGKLFGGRKTVIRTGYQMGSDAFFNNIASNAATSSPNAVVTQIFSTPTAAAPRGLANLSTNLPRAARAFNALDSQGLIVENLVNPYYQRWSFGVQRQFAATTILDVSYVGSKGTKLFSQEQFNPLVP